MRPTAISPRPDQISELTRGLQFPLPEIGDEHLKIIAEGLVCAFNDIRAQSASMVASSSEAEVTALMEARLNNLIEQDPFLGQLVLCVARGKESLSYDGSHLEKRPDLSIYLTNRNRSFPLITEAKILDSSTDKTETLYCKKGIRRFIDGEYAWGAREAFMLAYVRDGSSISTKLTPFLLAAKTNGADEYLVEELPTSQATTSFDLARSRHRRAFSYVHQEPPGDVPGPIALWHLWLV